MSFVLAWLRVIAPKYNAIARCLGSAWWVLAEQPEPSAIAVTLVGGLA